MNKSYRQYVAMLAMLLTMGWSSSVAQTNDIIHAVEYFWDTDLGFGQGIPISFTPGKEVNLENLQIPTDGIASGEHVVGIRAHTAQGWGPTIVQRINISGTSQHTGDMSVEAVEYFWDVDPGFGNGKPIPITQGKEVDLNNLQIPTDGIEPGEHVVGIRAHTAQGWGPTIVQRITISGTSQHTGDMSVEAVEYFWDDDPGFGKGNPVPITQGKEVDLNNLQIPTDGIESGEHVVGIRAYTAQGWGPTIVQRITVAGNSQISDEELQLIGLEYFWNEDPGYGQGTFMELPSEKEVTLENLQIPTLNVHGDATLFIRVHSKMGWGPTIPYSILVDAEGNYTLNSQAETSMTNRNYQSLADAFADFADRGVGDNIVLTIPTTNENYILDATTVDMLDQIAVITESIEQRSDNHEAKTIAFTATEGSGNTLDVTTTDDGLATVISLFAHTTLENVELTINGTPYDFTSAAKRSEEICADGETQEIPLSQISKAIQAKWTATPHTGTTISGYTTSGTGNIPAMTLTNSGTKLDSLAYSVTLYDQQMNKLTEYTYYIYVHSKVSKQTFSNLKPTSGKSLDPGEVTLSWNAINDAVGGYRVSINAVPLNNEGAEPTTETIDTDATSLTLTAETGMQYTWTVTAIGYCDELVSEAQTFTGRLLPDLVIESITLPEAAQAGNTLTVKAIVKNQGEGGTTEGTWTDRLYYVLNGTDFANAVKAKEMKHQGNIGAGESYEVAFEMTVPMADAGQLRVFVETDVEGKAMESNEDNNRTMSNTAAELSPFYMDANDLMALRKLYNDFNGTTWNGTSWDIASEIIKDGNWSGVTFNSDGQVTGINLQSRGLSGTLSSETAPNLPMLKSLNMSHNAIEGDAMTFIETLPALTNLNLSYNRLCELSEALSATVTQVNLGYQDMDRSISLSELFENVGDLTSLLPNISTYSASGRTFNFNGYFYLTNVSESGNQSWRINQSNGTLKQVANPTVIYNESNGKEVKMRIYNGSQWNDMRLVIDYEQGDVNLDWLRNVSDLQHLINFSVNDNHVAVFFNLQAGDLQPDEAINVLDLVRLINLLLADNGTNGQQVRKRKVPSLDDDTEAKLVIRDNELVLITEKPVSALDIVLEHNVGTQVDWLSTQYGWQISKQSTGSISHGIIYSMTHMEFPVGETVIARINDGDASIRKAMAADADAQEITLGYKQIVTGIHEMMDGDTQDEVYTIGGIKVEEKPMQKGLYIVNGNKQIMRKQ